MKRAYLLCILSIFIVLVSGFNKNALNKGSLISGAATPSPAKPTALKTLSPESAAMNNIFAVTPTKGVLPFARRCITLSNQLKNKPIGDFLLLPRTSNYDYDGNGAYLLDSAASQKTILSDNKIISRPIVSPNGNKVIYETSSDDKNLEYLNISNRSGKVEQKIALNDDLGSFWQWVDNDHVTLFKKRTDITGKAGEALRWDFYLYNLTDGTKQLYNTPLITYISGYLAGDFTFSENMGYLLTSWSGSRLDSHATNGYEIFDIARQKSSFLSGLGNYNLIYTKIPIWYDDTHAIIAMNNSLAIDLYMVDVNGQAQRLTYFGDYFKEVDILYWRLSPDKQFLGFSAEYKKDGKLNKDMFILDMKTGIVRDTCLKGDQFAYPDEENKFPIGNFYGPVWSPDSRHLLMENRYQLDASQLYWVDLNNNVAVPIAKNTQPLGWMAELK